MEAAFFDLDKTVIAKPSIMAFARDFRREGLLTRRNLVKGLWLQVVYVHAGAGPKKLVRMRQSVLALTAGWDQALVRRIVAEGLKSAIDPITYADARNLMDEHRRAGRRVYLVSAAPTEIVEPLAQHLGAHEALASVARVDGHGRYTGDVERYAYGPEKASLIRHLATRDGLDLTASWAYSDSATDVPMLEVVGHPVAVNPDRALRRVARLRGWEILRFERTLEAAHGTDATSHRDRPEQPLMALDSRRVALASRRAWTSWAIWGWAAAAAVAAGGAGAVAWRYRSVS